MGCEDDSEAEVAAAVEGAVAIAVGGAAEGWGIEPGSAAGGAEGCGAAVGEVGDGAAREGALPGVEAPFHDIAMEVVEAPGIGLFGAYGVGGGGAVFVVPGEAVDEGGVGIVAEGEAGAGAGAGGVFPFGFGGETVGVGVGEVAGGLLPLGEVFAVGHRFLPVDALDGAGGVVEVEAGVVAHEGDELGLGDFVLADPEASGEDDAGLGTFIEVAFRFIGRAPHEEFTGGDPAHPGDGSEGRRWVGGWGWGGIGGGGGSGQDLFDPGSVEGEGGAEVELAGEGVVGDGDEEGRVGVAEEASRGTVEGRKAQCGPGFGGQVDGLRGVGVSEEVGREGGGEGVAAAEADADGLGGWGGWGGVGWAGVEDELADLRRQDFPGWGIRGGC